MITIKIEKKISACCHLWDNFLPVHHHLKSGRLLAFENARVEDIENNYVQVFLDDKLIGLVYLQLFQFKQKHLDTNTKPTFMSGVIRFMLPAQLPLLVCGNLFRIDFQGFYFKNLLHQSIVFEAIKLFTQQNKRSKPCSIIIKDCKEMFSGEESKHFGYHFFSGDVTMEIYRRAQWITFNDYLKDLHKNYLQRAKKIIRAFIGIERKELQADDILKQTDEIEKLYWNVVNKQTIKLGTVNVTYFYELKKDLQQNFEFHALYLNNQMVGFYTFIFYAGEMETHFIGLDYEANKVHNIYFNILFLSTQKMIEGKYNKLELGRTAREAKLNLGAKSRQIFNYVKVKNPLIRLTVNSLLKKFNKESKLNQLERTPLK